MNRRQFTSNLTAAMLGSAALEPTFVSGSAGAEILDEQPIPKPLFELSVMLWTVFRELPFEQRLERVAQAGYQNVELVGEYTNWTEEDYKRVNAKRKELGIRFDTTAGLKNGLGNSSVRDVLLDELRGALVSMEKLDCPSIILLTGNVVPGLTREEQRQSSVNGLKAAAKLVEGKKIAGEPIRLLLESIDLVENPRYFLDSASEGFEIVREVNHPQVRFLYDLFHEQMGHGNLIEKLRKNLEYVSLIHVADVPGRHEPGTGEINYPNIFRTLAELKYDKAVAMEFLPTSDPVSKLIGAREMAVQYGR